MIFDDSKPGLKSMNSDAFGKQHFWVPIEKTEVDIKIKSSKKFVTSYKKNK